MDLIDTIIDAAKAYAREDARKIITDLLADGVQVKPAPLQMVDKAPAKDIPLTPLGEHIGLNGKKANVYRMQAPEPELPPDEIQRQQADLNRMSREFLDKMMGKK